MKKYLYLLLLFCGGISCYKTSAMAPSFPADTTTAMKGSESSVKSLIPIPVVYYTPDTRLGLGAAVIGIMRLRSHTDSSYTRLSTARLLADYTLNKQMDQQLEWSVFTREEKYLLRGELRHRVYTDRFYGIGNSTPLEDEGRYKYSYVSARLGGLKNLGHHVFLGLDFLLTNYYNLSADSLSEGRESLLLAQQITGYKGGLNSGAGLVLLFDTRDNTAFASKGTLFEVSLYNFGNMLGGDFDYRNVNLNFSKYLELKPGRVLAFNTVLNLNKGEVPVMRLAPAGGDKILRGYARNRFLDDNFVGTQVEYRFPLYRRFGLAAFAGLGDVFDQPSDVRFSTLKYSVGSGLRYALSQEEKLNIRIDLGYGREGSNFYVVIGEAF
ncbi:surface antigen-like protein [Pontibacter ummariensis]|uniref:Surface antigen n=1 Tax=Pontibacter ummariensis TaxID=1610492 RepID=A0A239KIV4_9BACT|nr:BamA/TamA family outer membrane protein [Pontibacter ummariensis]PRY05703.1 surface antigen-like protein [Pontibacter ummariensis]SNT18296.1 Surface antigen [Pontibacter ummariensis]